MKEQQLTRLLRQDPGRGLDALSAQYGGLILSVVRRVLPTRPQDAEEVAADVLVKAWQSADRLREDTLRGFLIVTARNLAIDRWRLLSRRREVALLEGDRAEAVEFWQTLESGMVAQELTDRILALPPPEGELFLRYYLLMETAGQIAERYGLSEGAVRARLRRTRDKLAAELRERSGQK